MMLLKTYFHKMHHHLLSSYLHSCECLGNHWDKKNLQKLMFLKTKQFEIWINLFQCTCFVQIAFRLQRELLFVPQLLEN